MMNCFAVDSMDCFRYPLHVIFTSAVRLCNSVVPIGDFIIKVVVIVRVLRCLVLVLAFVLALALVSVRGLVLVLTLVVVVVLGVVVRVRVVVLLGVIVRALVVAAVVVVVLRGASVCVSLC